MGPRALNALLGLWLFFSSFLLGRTPVQRWAGWVVGALTVLGALVSVSGRKGGRYLNLMLGGCLILFAVLRPRARAVVFWNDLLVGFAIALLSVVASTGDLRRRRAADV